MKMGVKVLAYQDGAIAGFGELLLMVRCRCVTFDNDRARHHGIAQLRCDSVDSTRSKGRESFNSIGPCLKKVLIGKPLAAIRWVTEDLVLAILIWLEIRQVVVSPPLEKST